MALTAEYNTFNAEGETSILFPLIVNPPNRRVVLMVLVVVNSVVDLCPRLPSVVLVDRHIYIKYSTCRIYIQSQ